MYLGIYLKSEEYSKENEVRILLVEDNDSRQDLSEFKKDDYRYELPIVEHFCTEFKTM